MRRVFCDACGAEMPDTDEKTVTVVGNMDLCEDCGKRLAGLDLKEAVLDALRQGLPKGQQEKPVVFPGRGGEEKAHILGMLERYHRKRGPGCLPELAARAGVEVEQLVKMEARGKLDLSVWRKVGRALEAAEGGG